MAKVFVNIVVKSIGVYFKSGNIYLTAETQEPVATESKTYETTGSKISILVENNFLNVNKAASLLLSTWKLATVELDTETRTKTDEKFGKTQYRYTAHSLELPAICEPSIVKS